MRFVHEQQHPLRRPIIFARLQMIDQRESQFRLVHVAIRQAQFEQDVLQQRASRAQPSAGQQGDLKPPLKVLRQYLQQQRLARPRGTDDRRRPLRAIDAAQNGQPSMIDSRRRKEGVSRWCGGEGTMREPKETLVHDPFPGVSPVTSILPIESILAR